MPIFDHDLFVKAQLQATGANIHAVCNLRSTYLALWEMGEYKKWDDPKWEQRFNEAETKLRKTVKGIK